MTTQEAADTAVFLLSPRSSGIVSQTIVVDAGMAVNYFDAAIVDRVVSTVAPDRPSADSDPDSARGNVPG